MSAHPAGAPLSTPLHARHAELGARMVEFGGWDMPLQYASGIVHEHLETRRNAGLFDVSHMGRFRIRGNGSAAFLNHALSSDVPSLEVGRAQYTMIPNQTGGAVDDAYLYRLSETEYLLVVNASNRERDWEHLRALRRSFGDADMVDGTFETAMVSLQGAGTRRILAQVSGTGSLWGAGRNSVASGTLAGRQVMLARTGYAGEPEGVEIVLASHDALWVWDHALERGATAVGLGARDTLRLEAGLPLFGHELGVAPDGREIPILACPLSRFAVSFAAHKQGATGHAALERQRASLEGRGAASDLPYRIRQIVLLEPGVARQGCEVRIADAPERMVGWITSGTVAPYWVFSGSGPDAAPTERFERRAVAMAALAREVDVGHEVVVDIRGRGVRALVEPRLLRTDMPPFARPVPYPAVR